MCPTTGRAIFCALSILVYFMLVGCRGSDKGKSVLGVAILKLHSRRLVARPSCLIHRAAFVPRGRPISESIMLSAVHSVNRLLLFRMTLMCSPHSTFWPFGSLSNNDRMYLPHGQEERSRRCAVGAQGRKGFGSKTHRGTAQGKSAKSSPSAMEQATAEVESFRYTSINPATLL